MKYISRIDRQEVNLTIDSSHVYGILLSGGLDSAILLYLIIRSNPTIKIQPFTIDKPDGALDHVRELINHFNKKFNLSIPQTIIVGDPTVYHREQSVVAVKEIFKKYMIDYLYIGINQNPPELNNLPHAPQRTTRSDNPKILLPFVHLLKNHIVDFALEYNQNDLFEITHTCTEQKEGRCNMCWQCTERSWAFSKLNVADTGSK